MNFSNLPFSLSDFKITMSHHLPASNLHGRVYTRFRKVLIGAAIPPETHLRGQTLMLGEKAWLTVSITQIEGRALCRTVIQLLHTESVYTQLSF